MTKIVPVLSGIVLAAGVLIYLYPAASSYLAKKQQENVIVGYEDYMEKADNTDLEKEWEKAKAYNKKAQNYEEVLNIEKNGVMGYLEISKIDVKIPIYHHATEESLKKGIGHLERSGLPIGGIGNHSVLTGHRGLPNAEMFTRLDELEKGDFFSIHVLGETLLYQVIRIQVIIPKDINKIIPEQSKDLVTLVTCTPYGVNTHRLLITGERTEHGKEDSMEQEVNTTNKSRMVFCIIILVIGITVICFPHISHNVFEKKTEARKAIFITERNHSVSNTEKLYNELKRQNEELYVIGQKDFLNEEAYKVEKINLKMYGINDNTIGYISIPKMNITLPVLLGASEINMKKGAVHLTETSYPIGGDNTNCVIAAHRGFSKTAMFRDIEKLKTGDKIYVDNFKETLKYKVVKRQIILPTDTERILIQEGKDMITLITCHPYRKNTRRYVVFCERV